MASIETEGQPSAAPAAESWPLNDLGDDTPLGLPVDEMFARQLHTGFAGAVRSLVTETPKTLLEWMKGLTYGPAARAPVTPRPD